MPSRIGIHFLSGTAEAVRFVQAGAPVALLCDNLGAGFEYVNINPRMTIIGRRLIHYLDRPDTEITDSNARERGWSGEKAAIEHDRAMEDAYRLNPQIKIWQGLNEPDVSTISLMMWYAAFESKRIELLARRGLRACIGNFSVGTPHIAQNDLSFWNAFRPALNAALAHGSILGLHEYSDSTLPTQFETVRRHEWVYDWFMNPKGYGSIPFVCTEFGRIDYRDHISSRRYAEEMIATDRVLRQRPECIGICVFTFGDNSGSIRKWKAYNVEGDKEFTDIVTEYMRATANQPDPTPEPTPMPTPEPTIKVFDTDDEVKVTATALNFRLTPSAANTSNIIVPLPKDTRLIVGRHITPATDRRDWHRVLLLAGTNLVLPLRIHGYVAGEFLALADPVPAPAPQPAPTPTPLP